MSTLPSPSVTMAGMSPPSPKRGVKALPSSSALFDTGGASKAVLLTLSQAHGAGAVHKLQEAIPIDRVVFEQSREKARDRCRSRLVNAPCGHALVQGVDQDGNATWLQNVVDGRRDLRRHRFLSLQPLRIKIDDAGDF